MINLVRKRVVAGLGANAYNQVVAIVTQLAGVPILLFFWGERLYGEWLILFAIPAYLSLSNLGFSLAAANDMTASVAAGDRAEALAVFQSLLMLLAIVVTVGLLIATALVLLLPFGRWFHFTGISLGQVRWTLWLLSSAVLVMLVNGAIHAGFRASGEYALHVAATSTLLLLQQISVWLVAASGLGPALAGTAYAAVSWTLVPVMWLALRHRHPWLRLGAPSDVAARMRRLVRPAAANMALPVSLAVSNQGMVLVVGAILGPPAVVVFSTMRTLSRFVVRLGWGINHALEPEIAAAWGARDCPLVRRLYLQGTSATFWGAVVICSTLFASGNWIMRLWTHGRIGMDPALFGWLLLSALACVVWYGSLNLLKSMNAHLHASVCYVISAFIGVGFAAVVLEFTARLSDAAAALLLTDVVMVVYLTRATARTIRSGVRELALGIIDPRSVLRFALTEISHGR